MFIRLSYFDLWWPQMTFDLSRKTIGIIYSQRATYKPSLKFTQLSHLEITCSQGFQTLTSGDLNDLWPQWKTIQIIYTSRATNIPCLKFQQLSLIAITCLQGFQTLTSGDFKWPLTSMENNRDHLPTKGHQQTKFEVYASFTYWDIVFTSKCHTRTPTRHYHRIDSFGLRQGIKKGVWLQIYMYDSKVFWPLSFKSLCTVCKQLPVCRFTISVMIP